MGWEWEKPSEMGSPALQRLNLKFKGRSLRVSIGSDIIAKVLIVLILAKA